MTSVESIVDVNILSEWLNLKTEYSKERLKNKLDAWSSDSQHLLGLSARFKRFKAAIEKDPQFFKDCDDIFVQIADIEKNLNKLLKPSSELEKESYNEIIFLNKFLQPLNFIPFILMIWSFVRVYVLPGLSFIVPFLTLLAPYIILKLVIGLPITFNRYMNMLHSMISGNFNKIMDPNSVDTGFTPAIFLKQFGIIVVTIVQGVIQPYWSYKHLKSIDRIIEEKGDLILKFRDLYSQLQNILLAHGFTFFKCPLPEMFDRRTAAARAIIDATYFKMALKYVGSLEVIMSLANKKEVNPVKWVTNDKPIFLIKETFDFQVPEEKRKTICANFSLNRHALLTGPNKGGKSTVLRALSTSALLAHTYGCAFGNLTATPFVKLFVCLKPDDLPGSKSRFEREIQFTASTLKTNAPTLIFIDELYHSTNPPDALRSCEIYCGKLWQMPNTISVISTHLFELVEKAGKDIQRLCCPASTDDKGNIHFEYTLENGICKVSSVDELLKNEGLLCA
jgi:MutS domain V